MALTSKSSSRGFGSRLYIMRDVMEVVGDNIIRIICICGMGGVGNKKPVCVQRARGARTDMRIIMASKGAQVRDHTLTSHARSSSPSRTLSMSRPESIPLLPAKGEMNRNQYHMQEVTRVPPHLRRDRSSAKPWAGWGNGERKIIVLNELCQPINENKHQLATQLGYFAREGHLFPLDVPTWKHMKQHDLDTIWENVQERSKINKQNKAQQTIVHTTRSKGFHCLEYEMEDVEALQIQSQLESGMTMDDNQAFPQVLGHIYSRIRGRGAGPKLVSSSARAREKEEQCEREADEAIRRLKVCKARLINLRKI